MNQMTMFVIFFLIIIFDRSVSGSHLFWNRNYIAMSFFSLFLPREKCNRKSTDELNFLYFAFSLVQLRFTGPLTKQVVHFVWMSRGYYDAEQQVSDLAEHLATNWEI